MPARRVGRGRPPVALLVCLLAALAVAACTADEEPAAEAPTAAETTARRARGDLRPTIRLGVGDWTGAQLNAAIAEQLIERRLGYPVETELVTDIDSMLGDLETGELQAVLEMWPSSLDGADGEAVAGGRIVSLGELGVVGRAGWFVPRYLVEDNPALATWEGLTDPAVAAEFATAETAPLGRFLGTDPAYEQADEELIETLDLPFSVVYSGSDAATAAEVERAIATGAPIVLFWWLPTAEVSRFDLVPVSLPPRTADCERQVADGGPLSCAYADDRLVKLGSPALDAEAPDVASFLRSFSLTTADQQLMIDRVENAGVAVDTVAAEWIDVNSSRWEGWFG